MPNTHSPLSRDRRDGPGRNTCRHAAALLLVTLLAPRRFPATAQAPSPAAQASAPTARELGLEAGGQGRIEEAYALLLPWVRTHSGDAEARVAAAYCAVELERGAEAEELLGPLPQDYPRAQLLRGRSRLVNQDPRGALGLLDPLAQNGPADLQAQARRYAAIAHLAIGESRAAAALLVGRVGNDSSTALLLAQAQLQSGEAELAVATLAPFAQALPAIEAPPVEKALAAQVALESGRALVRAERFGEASTVLEKATRWAPGNPEAWQLLGQAQVGVGKRAEAAVSLTRFGELSRAAQRSSRQIDQEDADRGDPTGKVLREAAGLAAAGRIDDALLKIRHEEALVPNDPRPRTAEIDTLLAAGRNAAAIEALQSRIAAHPQDAEAASRLQRLLDPH